MNNTSQIISNIDRLSRLRRDIQALTNRKRVSEEIIRDNQNAITNVENDIRTLDNDTSEFMASEERWCEKAVHGIVKKGVINSHTFTHSGNNFIRFDYEHDPQTVSSGIQARWVIRKNGISSDNTTFQFDVT